MAGWKTISGPLGTQIDQVDAAQVFQPGTAACAVYVDSSDDVTLHGEFTYQKGVASCALGSWVAINPDNDTVSLLGDAFRGGVAVATAATIASTWGWFQRTGKADALVEESVGDNAALFATTSAGEAGPTGSGLTEIIGAVAAAASGTSSAPTITHVELSYPVCCTNEAA